MSCNFYIVDDDRSVRKMIMKIIESHFENATVFQNDSPWMSVQDILRHQPDLVILDLLMEDMDGVEVAQKLRTGLYKGKIIMLSEVTDKEMVEKAYEAGVDDYISKPINVTEVVKVLHRNIENLQLKSYIRLIGYPNDPNSLVGLKTDTSKIRNRIITIYKDLGIVGEPGTEELIFWITSVTENPNHFKNTEQTLCTLYEWLKVNYPIYEVEPMSVKGIEQRLRRLVITSTENLAHMGIEDFSCFRFEKYSSALFNFKTIKQEMDSIRNNSSCHGKVDVKRFIDGFLCLLE